MTSTHLQFLLSFLFTSLRHNLTPPIMRSTLPCPCLILRIQRLRLLGALLEAGGEDPPIVIPVTPPTPRSLLASTSSENITPRASATIAMSTSDRRQRRPDAPPTPRSSTAHIIPASTTPRGCAAPATSTTAGPSGPPRPTTPWNLPTPRS